ncbi:MAG: PDZ domain-containing protein [Candidatus Omnitrophota bacterium]
MQKKIVFFSLFLLIVCAVMVFTQWAAADVITLKDGRKIEGSILKEQADSYIVKIKIGTITVDKSMIESARRMSDEENYVAAGDRYLDSENYDEALAQYKKALNISPDFQPAKDGAERSERIKRIAEDKKQKELESKKRELLDKQKVIAKTFGFELKAVGGQKEIIFVVGGGQADLKGLKQNDVIIRINDLLAGNETLDKILDYLISGESQTYNFTARREVILDRKRIIYQKRPFAGLGIFLESSEGNLVISSLIPCESAEKAGLRPSDIVISVNGESVAGMPLDEVVGLLTGAEFSRVTLLIERGVSLTKQQARKD